MNSWMRFITAVAILLSGPAFAADEATVTIFLGKESDICPGGYSPPQKCPRFTAARFEDMKRKKALQRLGSPKTINLDRNLDQPLNIQLGNELGLIRRFRAAGSHTSALILVEWRKAEVTAPASTPSYGPTDITDDDIITSALENRRAFSHANVRNLDPEERYVWTLFRGGKPFSLVFE